MALAIQGLEGLGAQGAHQQAACDFVGPHIEHGGRRAGLRHAAIEVFQQGHDLLTQHMGGLGLEGLGQQTQRPQREHVLLNGLQGGEVVGGPGIEQLRDALHALGAVPVAGEHMGVLAAHNFLVGRGVPASGLDGGAVTLRVFGVVDPAHPIVVRQPARHGRHTAHGVELGADGELANRMETHFALRVGHHHALHGAVVQGIGIGQLGHRLGLVGSKAGHHGPVVPIKGRPAQGHDVAIGVHHFGVLGLHIADHRAMAGAAHREVHIGLAFHADHFLALLKGLPPLGGEVLARPGGIDGFEVEVLHIGAGVGEAPSHAPRSTQHHKRQTGQGGAHHVQGRTLV